MPRCRVCFPGTDASASELSGGGLAVEFRICTTPAVFLTGNMFPPGRTFEEPQMIHANWRVVNWGKFLPRFTTCPEMKG